MKTELSPLEHPSARLTEPERCAVCDTYMPEGWYAIVADDGSHLCTASCLAKVAPICITIGHEALDEDECEERIEDLREKARSNESEADYLENRAGELRAAAEELKDKADQIERQLRRIKELAA